MSDQEPQYTNDTLWNPNKLTDRECEVLEECAEIYCNEKDPRVIVIRQLLRRLG